MHWDEDIDLLVVKKPAPKQGRRSNKNLEDTEIIQDSPKEDVRSKTRKTGVWSDEPLKTTRSDTGRNIIELERFQNDKKTDVNDDIPIIPDIDDASEDLASTISVDKSVKEINSQVSSLKVDESKVWMLGDIDLSCLTSKLYPEKDVQEFAEEWTLDSLFNDLLINTEIN
ncbi:intraflagellar transport protein 43 homolog [Diorhabda carinulata]|uniref:intraflagellar transport protein 43 homolog n=1 Tax=Diorhabda sublineata TaxID=1163346 RepID=UPI0024E0A9F0|nr:intraflagellar transport protein 43 homolog [Diorhabda sublineata]XP_057667992.1 intraflagellar transport protein 43 homolog [Diorhabda carinulata]